jgi:hypothetical protein
MAQTKKKRRRKHRGTQGGGISTRPKGRPKNRAEARARAQARRNPKNRGKKAQARTLSEPTWGSAAKKGALAAGIFFLLLALVFREPPLASAMLAIFMTGFYVPIAFMTDRFFYNRELRKRQQAKAN